MTEPTERGDSHPEINLSGSSKSQESELPPLTIPDIPSERIYILLISFYAILILIRILFLPGPSLFSLIKYLAKPGITPPATGSILMDFFLYMCVACQFFPIPTLPPIAFMAKVFHPILVSVIGSLGTCIANLNDYAILGWLFRHHRVKKIRDVNSYRRFLHFFDRYAFLALTVGAFLPIPVDVVRLMAISRAYTYWKYLLATFVGRFPRYLLIAYLGKELPVKYILILFLLSTLPAAVKIISGMIKKRKKT
jgi:membrane protein YqaA with SNARE-associated domain